LSRFEWVDSVLVKAIEQGEWVIFENANLCNPSILDRLNSLLEEGNNTLSINEQGMVGGDELREVRAHPDFRPIFLMTKKTLNDQGRDVSRALRNRCLQIDVELRSAQDPTGLEEDLVSSVKRVSALVEMQDGRVIDPFHDSLRFDLFPLRLGAPHRQSARAAADGQTLEPQVRLGKRKKPASQTLVLANDIFAKYPLAATPFGDTPPLNSDSYLFMYLSQIENPAEVLALYLKNVEQVDSSLVDWSLATFDQRQHPQGWMAWFIGYRAHQLAA